MSLRKRHKLLWIGGMICILLITLAWIGYKSVGYQLLLGQLPLCS